MESVLSKLKVKYNNLPKRQKTYLWAFIIFIAVMLWAFITAGVITHNFNRNNL